MIVARRVNGECGRGSSRDWGAAIRRVFPGPVLLALLLFAISATAARGQVPARQARLTLSIDYATQRVSFDGTVLTAGAVPELSSWGMTVRQSWRRTGSGPWSVRGSVDAARLDPADSSGAYRLHLGPMRLEPGDVVTLLLPFDSIDYGQVLPPPDNLAQLQSVAAAPSGVPPGTLGLSYSDSDAAARALTLDIPLAPERKQIALTLTPLIGEMLLGRIDSLRLSGHVTFDGIRDYGELASHCQVDTTSPTYRYRVSDLLFALDSPPAFSASLLNPVYQFKPVQLFLSADVQSCHFDASGGTIAAGFVGRITALPPTLSQFFPQGWIADTGVAGDDQIVLASNRQEVIAALHRREYQLVLGGIALGPNDRLVVTLPGADIRAVSPPPSRLDSTPDHDEMLTYSGPQQLALSITYAPGSRLVASQLPVTIRALVRPLERALALPSIPLPGAWSPVFDARGAPAAWRFAPVPLVLLLLIAPFCDVRLRTVLGGAGWVAAAVVLLYGAWGVYGLLVLAVLAMLAVQAARTPSSLDWRGGLAALGLIWAAMYGDDRAQQLFATLSPLNLQTTPVTPIVLLLLGIALGLLLVLPGEARRRLDPSTCLVAAAAVSILATADVLQKSLPALVVLGAGVAYLRQRLGGGGDMSMAGAWARLRSAWQGRVVPIGIVLLVLFAVQQGLGGTTAVLGSFLGIWTAPAASVLLLASLLESYLAIALLFLLVYPALPFSAGYLKAAVLAAFLLLVFILGVGSDDSLLATLPTLIVDRAVYYLSVPLLIGLYFDIDRFRRRVQAQPGIEGKGAEGVTFAEAASDYLKRLQTVVGTASGIAALVLPQAYALVTGTPVVASYFDLLTKLLSQAPPV